MPDCLVNRTAMQIERCLSSDYSLLQLPGFTIVEQ